ncbi:winged helix-turn-helix domain-containing protein [Halorussus salinisoli]|uniref:winged helix-turn-helix domain-containing protein n=1 Tax=Halorussus salinisoli TaxID=2558242 RepID=UPI0010C21AEB|nr:winged helix-turn-helix domain-containing protein [Halorussus salinisoli]
MSQDQNRGGGSPPHVAEEDVLSIDSESESLDSVFRALSDHRRRCLCHYLARNDGPMTVDELAELLAASMSEKTRAVLTTAEIEKTRTELHRMHLPKLTEAGIVEHDGDEGVVRLADSPGVTDCLQAASGVDLQ